jgi:cysteinyl-tRNA synthetase
MAAKYLGPEFDIHGGGLDLRFPHHENELAQSTAAGQPFARLWMHNAMVTMAGEKMSKSLGNSALVSEVVQRFRAVELRYYLVAPHYRSVVEFSDESLAEAAAAYGRLEGYVTRASEMTGGVDPADGAPSPEFVAAMDEDLGTPAALAAIHELVRTGNKLLADGDSPALQQNLASVRRMLDLLGLDPLHPQWATVSGSGAARDTVGALVEALLQQRQEARARKDWAAADAVRDQLKAAGVEIEDTPTGPRWTLPGS